MTTPRTPRRSTSRTAHGAGKVLAVVVGLPLAFASMLSLAHCDTDGVTPVCPVEGGGDCITPPGTSSASVVNTTGGAAGTSTTGAGGSASTGGSAGTLAAGSGGTIADGGLTSLLDVALDINLGQ